MLTKVI